MTFNQVQPKAHNLLRYATLDNSLSEMIQTIPQATKLHFRQLVPSWV